MGRKQQLRRARNKTKKNDNSTREVRTTRPPVAAALAPPGVENVRILRQMTMTTAEEVAYTVTDLELREASAQSEYANHADDIFLESDFGILAFWFLSVGKHDGETNDERGYLCQSINAFIHGATIGCVHSIFLSARLFIKRKQFHNAVPYLLEGAIRGHTKCSVELS